MQRSKKGCKRFLRQYVALYGKNLAQIENAIGRKLDRFERVCLFEMEAGDVARRKSGSEQAAVERAPFA